MRVARPLLLVLVAVLVWSADTPTVSAQDTRILFVPAGSVPARLRRSLTTLLSGRGQMVSYTDYASAAGQQNLRPSSRGALRRVAPSQGATVIVVASYGGHYRRRTLRVRFLNGSSGEAISAASYPLSGGQNLRAASQHAILRALSEATGGQASAPSSSPDPAPNETSGGNDNPGNEGGGLPPPLDWEAEEAAATGEDVPPPPPEGGEEGESNGEEGASESELPIEEQRQWGFAVSAGGGVMNRTASVPGAGGETTLSTLPFPAIQAEVVGSVRPDLSSRFRLELAARYTTSVGLVAEDELSDGRTRSTDMRSHHFRLGLRTQIPLAPGARPTVLLLEAGMQLRMLDSEIEVSIPDYTLGGFVFRVGLFFTIGDSPISLGIVPEIGHAGNLSEALADRAQVSDGFIVGAEAVVRIQLIDELALMLMYREAHAFLGSELDEQLSDAERYGILRLEYRF
ncbi:MAG: hypothetical protein AB8I08_10790 [Sandaracinaceae bacterium]